MNERLPELLKRRLAEPLPGAAVDALFGVRPMRLHHYDPPPPDARRAAVLILFYPHEGAWHLPLTLRPAHLEDHAGQVSFPGGAIEPDETAREAAIREFHEELGAERHAIEPLGTLSPIYVQASHFRITPWVAVAGTRPDFQPNPAEVEQLIEAPLSHLLDPANHRSHRREHAGETFSAPHFHWQSHQIWGATCLMLGELVMVLEGIPV